jgi:hypothetical protein
MVAVECGHDVPGAKVRKLYCEKCLDSFDLDPA